jgi:translation elongation factor P/translation initiation factor 5A
MTVTDLKWHTRDDGETWTLSGDYKGVDAAGVVRRLFEVKYLGRGRGGGPMRWKVTDAATGSTTRKTYPSSSTSMRPRLGSMQS